MIINVILIYKSFALLLNLFEFERTGGLGVEANNISYMHQDLKTPYLTEVNIQKRGPGAPAPAYPVPLTYEREYVQVTQSYNNSILTQQDKQSNNLRDVER